MKTILVFPPVWECSSPYPSLAVLSAYLKEHKIEVDIMDLNIEIQYMLFKDFSYIDRQIDKLKKKLKSSKDKGFTENANLCIWLYQALRNKIKTDVISCIQQSSDEFNETKYKFVCNYFRFIYSAYYYPSRFSDLKYVSPYPMDNLTDIFKAVTDIEHNIFYEILKNEFVDKISEYDIIGLSIASFNQLIPGLTFAGVIKERYPEKQIILGGAIVPYLEKSIYYNADIFKYVDYIITGEGETALKNCIDYIEGKENIVLSNTFFYDNENQCVCRSLHNTIENVEELPCPDYSKYPFEKYFCRKIMLSYVSSRGCFWNKCTFCSLTCSYGNKYRERSIEKVMDDLCELVNRHKIERVSFNDEALTASRIKKISEKKLERNMQFKWSCLARLNNFYNEEDLKLAYKSGLKMMSMGLESGSENVLDAMNKGIEIKKVPEILKLIHNIGIWTNVYFIIGFPNESEEDFNTSLKFLKENEENIDSLCYTYFRLEDNSYIFNHPQNYSITINEYKKDYFGPSYDFVSETISEFDLLKRHNLLTELLIDKKCYTYNVYFDFDSIFSFISEDKKDILNRFIKSNIAKNRKLRCLYKKNFTNCIFEVNTDFVFYCRQDIICALNKENFEMYSINRTAYDFLRIIIDNKEYAKIFDEIKKEYISILPNVLAEDLKRIIYQLLDMAIITVRAECFNQIEESNEKI